MKPVRKHSIEDHGFEHSQFFQGAGVACTDWQEVFTGCAPTPYDALEDALEQAAMSDWNVEDIINDMSQEAIGCNDCECSDDEEACEMCENHHFMSVYVK